LNVSGGGVCVQPVVVVRTVQLARPNDTCRRSRLSPSSCTPSLLRSALAELGASSTPRRERLRPQASVTPVCIACPAREASDPQARRCGKALRTWQVEGHKGILPTYVPCPTQEDAQRRVWCTWSQKQDQAELWVANLVGSAVHAVPRAQRFAVALAR
jgi:hypothetical protein